MEWLVTKPCSPALGGDADTTYLGKLIQFEEVLIGTSTQEEHRLGSHILDTLSEVKQWSHTDTATYQEELLSLARWHREAIAQRQHTVEVIASLECTQLASAITHHRYKQP